MTSIAVDLAQLLTGIRRAGDFCTGGACDILAPGLEVKGIGPIALPLLPVQAEQLIALAKRAPFGRGEQTLVDIEVRRTWQIDASAVEIRGKGWAKSLEGIVQRAAEGLGVTDPVSAELYKLLVYDEGSFFVSHRDTEKTDGMFATLVVVLASNHTGGELLVRHQGRDIRFDLHCPEPSQAAFAAFYADCPHEVLPVTSGCRLALIYNLSRRGPGQRPKPPSYDAERTQLATVLRAWAEDEAIAPDRTWTEEDDLGEDGPPRKLIFPLEHAYSPAGLSFEALKGADSARAVTLLAAAEEAGCDLHLALLSIEESGSADYRSDYRSSRRGRYEDDGDAFEAGAVDDRSATLSDWRGPGGRGLDFGALPFDDTELSPPDVMEDLPPHEENFQEATGNEGATFERSYRMAALVLWPKRSRLAVLNRAGLPATLSYLAGLAERWSAEGGDDRSPLWIEAHELSSRMLASWPSRSAHRRDSPSEASTMLGLLSRLGDTSRIDEFLSGISAAGRYGPGDNAGLLQAIRLLPRRRTAELFESIVAANGAKVPDACAELLLLGVAAMDGLGLVPADLLAAGAALVQSLPGDPARAPKAEPWMRARTPEPGLVTDVLAALEGIDAALAAAAVETFLAWPKTYDPDATLVPAMLAIGKGAGARTAAVARLREACSAHLRARIAEPLAPPADWSRPGKVACSCRHCSELNRFLPDPARETWTLAAPQADRSHVETQLLNGTYDLRCTTLRKGSPHSLICSKTQASYERRVVQRSKDLDALARIEARPAG